VVSNVSINWSVEGCFGHVFVMPRSNSDGGVSFSNILFVTNFTFKKVNGLSSIAQGIL